jgi:hypothetical protein
MYQEVEKGIDAPSIIQIRPFVRVHPKRRVCKQYQKITAAPL